MYKKVFLILFLFIFCESCLTNRIIQREESKYMVLLPISVPVDVATLPFGIAAGPFLIVGGSLMSLGGGAKLFSFYQPPSNDKNIILIGLSIPFLIVGGIIGLPALMAAHYGEPVFNFNIFKYKHLCI